MLSILLASISLSAPPRPAPQRKAVVVGAGVGGLYVAASLAKSGVDVTVVEKNAAPCAGGRLGVEVLRAPNGRAYRFETGPSLLLLPEIYREMFSSLGLDPDEHLRLARVRPSYAVHFADGLPTPLLLGGDADDEAALRERMERVEPNSYTAYRHYLRSARANLQAGLPIFIREQLGLDEALTLPPFLTAALLGGSALDGAEPRPLVDWPLRSHGAQMRDTFACERHQLLASFQDLYIGLAPPDAPAVFSLLQAIEIADAGDDGAAEGIFYPMGGWSTVRDGLIAAARKHGVNFEWRTRADEVRVDRDTGAVVGVRVSAAGAAEDAWGVHGEPPGSTPGLGGVASKGSVQAEGGRLIESACVVVNADLPAAETQLLPPELRRSEYAELSEEREARSRSEQPAGGQSGGRRRGWRYSTSSVSFFFCLDRRYEQLRHHNVFLAGADAWRGLFDATAYGRFGEGAQAGAGAPPPLHFYVHAPSRTDPSVCERASDDAVMVLFPVPPIDERMSADEAEEATARLVERARACVLGAFAAAGMEGFERAVVDERVRTPLGWRDAYNVRRGSVFGLAHDLPQLALFRPARRHGPSARGLFWVGASTRPGNGVPLVLIGAQKVARDALASIDEAEADAAAAASAEQT